MLMCDGEAITAARWSTSEGGQGHSFFSKEFYKNKFLIKEELANELWTKVVNNFCEKMRNINSCGSRK